MMRTRIQSPLYINEIASVAKHYNIREHTSIDKIFVFKYLDSVIKPLTQVEEITSEKILTVFFNKTYAGFNFDAAKTQQLREICEKIIYNGLCVEEDQVVEYGRKVNDLIIKANIDTATQETLKVANNITINSSLYWSEN